MSWRFEIITTETDGEIVNRQDFPAVDGDFSIERTAGDEFFLKSGDITIKTREAISIDTTGSRTNYLLAYWNEVLSDAFYIPRDFDEQDQKFNKFKTKFFAVQKIFFDNLKSVDCAHSTDITLYNDAFEDAYFDIKFYETPGLTRTGTCWPVGSLVKALATNKKANGFGYRINSVSFPGNTGEVNDVGLFHLETPEHFPSGEPSLATLVSDTFDGGETGASDIDMSNWLGVFKLAALMHNAFIVVKPVGFIESGTDYFGVDVTIKERSPASADSVVATRWKTRKKNKDKYRLDGVVIRRLPVGTLPGSIFYSNGNLRGANVYEKTTPLEITLGVMNPGPADVDPNLSVGNWDSADSSYDIRTAAAPPNRDYFTDGHADVYFDPLIDQGHGYKGEIFWNGQDLLDHILIKTGIADEYIQINKIKVNRLGTIAKIEGIQIAQ